MVDREITLSCVLAWVSTIATAALIGCAWLMWTTEDTRGPAVGATAAVTATAAATAHVRSFLVAHAKMMRLLLASRPVDTELRRVR